jgi:hypothetical protein
MANNKEDVMKQWRISLWTDSVSESVPHLIVSRDLIDEDGGALTSQTLRVFLFSEHSAAERCAQRFAQREHLPLGDETARPAGR